MVTFWKGAQGPRVKYNARHVRCELGGRPHSHDSVAERNRCHVLHVKQERGEVSGLRCQVSFSLDVNGVHICRYVADFVYTTVATDQLVVEDKKGVRTREYGLKCKLMRAVHGISILET